MSIVDLTYYTDEYLGEDISPELFSRFELRAEEVVNSISCGAVDNFSKFTAKTQKLIKKSICAQAEYYSQYGQDIGYDANSVGFTTGKFHIDGTSGSGESSKYSLMLCPRAIMFLEQASLLIRKVGVIY